MPGYLDSLERAVGDLQKRVTFLERQLLLATGPLWTRTAEERERVLLTLELDKKGVGLPNPTVKG
jgi:hypothetical protein